MAEKDKTIIIITIILAVALLKYNSFFVILSPSVKGFTQYESDACEGGFTCQHTLPLTKSNTANFNIQNNWTVINTGGSWGSCGTESNGNIIGGCCTTTEVLKNGILIDTIKQGYAGNLASTNTPYSRRVYCEDGTFDNCAGKEGIEVKPLQWSVVISGECRNRRNDFTLFFGDNTGSIDISSLKSNYNIEENISISVKIINNLISTTGKLKLNYEVPTIIGNAVKTESRDVNIDMGENNYILDIPSDKLTEQLRIQPELEFYYPTTGISGVNYVFEGEGLAPITNKDRFILSTTTGNLSEFSITKTPDTIIINNQTIIYQNVTTNQTIVYQNITTNQTITNQTVIEKIIKVGPTFSERYGAAGFIFIILGAVVVWLIVKGKK